MSHSFQIQILDLCQKHSNIDISEDALFHIESFIETLTERLSQISTDYNIPLINSIQVLFPGHLGRFMAESRPLTSFNPDEFTEYASTSEDQNLLASAFEFFCYELVQTAEIQALMNSRNFILPIDIQSGVERDTELFYVFRTNHLYVIHNTTLLPRNPFKHITKEIITQLAPEPIKISKRALYYIQAFIENRVVSVLETSNSIRDSGRNKLCPSDIKLAYNPYRFNV